MAVFGEVEKVDGKLIHKDHDDDILIYNGRGALPAKIDEDVFKSLNKQDADFLSAYYRAHKDNTSAQDKHTYYLRTLPPVIGKNEVCNKIATAENLGFLFSNYREDVNCYVLNSEYVCEIDEILILQTFGNRAWRITESERARISRIIDTLPGIDRPNIYYVNMLNDTKNYFFYRKHHEHVPGIMLIEVARQAMYAHFYRYSKHRRGEVTLTIDTVRSDFTNYTDANYPVRIKVEDAPVEKNNKIEAAARYATFYQGTSVVANVYISGVVIKMSLFKRLRNVHATDTHRFIPMKNVGKTAFLTGKDGKNRECTINNLSMKGLNLTFPAASDVKEGGQWDFCFYVEELGFINGTAEVRWTQSVSGGIKAGMLITDMAKDSKVKLRETIKNFTYIIADREIV